MSEPRTNCAPECVRGWHAEGCPNAPIPATLRHDAGAVARCSYCRRYTLDPAALSGGAETPRCDCGDSYGWSGSFEPPGPDAVWSHDYSVPAPPPGDGPRTLGRGEPVQWRIVVCGAGEDDAPRPAPDDGRPMHFVCPGCGPHVAADEDGCCVHCGADCDGGPCGGHVCGTELEAACAEAGRLREEVRLVRAALEAHPDSDLVALAAATLRQARAADDEHAEAGRLRKALSALLDRLDEMDGPLGDILVVRALRTGQQYAGPNWSEPYVSARAALSASADDMETDDA